MSRLLLCLSLLSAVTILSAQRSVITITESYRNTPLKVVLTQLTDQYDLKIAYSDDLIDGISVTADIKDHDLSAAFTIILSGSGFIHEFIPPKTILIKKQPHETAAQTKTMYGSVRDANSGEKLPFVYFYQPLEGLSTNSNQDGYFTLSDVSAGSKIMISYIGYRDTTLSASLFWQEERLSISLQPEDFRLSEVIVDDQANGGLAFSSTTNLASIAFSPSFARAIPATGESDVFRAMQLLPGVSATNELSSGLAINGGTATQNLVLFDGIPIYHVDHFFGYFSAINPNAVKSLNLYKGGFEAKYGGRSSSLVNIIGNDGNGEEVSGQISFNELSLNTSLAVPISDKSRIFFSARRSYTDILETSLFESIFSLYETDLQSSTPVSSIMVENQTYSPEFYYTDLSFKFSTDLSHRDLLELSFYDSNDILNFTEDYTAILSSDTSFHVKNIGFINWGNIGSSLKLSRLWNANHYSNVLFSYSNYASEYQELHTLDYNGSIESGLSIEQDNMIQDISLKLDHEWRLAGKKLETGLQYSNYTTSINSELNDSSVTDVDQDNIHHLIHYVQYPVIKNSHLEVIAGIRNNYLSSTNEFYTEPRLNFSLQLTDRLFVHGATGIYRQFINQIQTENALQGSRDLWLISDDQIADQKSNHFLLGAEYFKGGLSFSANYFHKRFEGLLDYAFSNGGLVTPYDNYEQLFFQGESTAKGLELMLKQENNRFTGWVSYTLSESLTKYAELNGGSYFPSDNDQRHELTLFGSYAFDRLTLFSTWYYGSGLPYTEYILREVRNERNDRVTSIYSEGQNSERLPKYHRLDVGLSYDWFFQEAKLRLSGKIFNLYNRVNIYDQRVEIITPPGGGGGNRRALPRLLPYNLSLMGFTPSFSVAFEF